MKGLQQTPIVAQYGPERELPAGLVCGVPVQAARRDEFVAAILAAIAEKRAAGRAGRRLSADYVATINSDFLANTRGRDAASSARLLKTLRQARFSTADGMPIVWLLRATGLPVPERVTGVDLFSDLLRALPRDERRVFIVGGDYRNFRRAAKRMHGWTSNLRLHGAFPRLNSQGELIDADTGRTWDELRVRRFFNEINRKAPSVLCLALGNPRQELFYDRYRHLIQVPVVMGLGGTINFIAGSVRRAPALLGRLGFEWAFRLAMEPRRLAKRYLSDALHLVRTGGPLLILHALQKLQVSRTRRNAGAYFTADSRPDLLWAAKAGSTETTKHSAKLDLTHVLGADARGLETIRRCVEDPRIQVRGIERCGRLLRAALRIHQIDTGVVL